MRVVFNGNIPHQGGSGLPAFQGYPYQRGSGLGSLFKGLLRFVLPLAKSAGKVVGKETLRTAASIANDVVAGGDIKESAKKHVKRGAQNLVKKGGKGARKMAKRGGKQRGGALGRRAKPRNSINTGGKRRKQAKGKKKEDIFDRNVRIN